MNNIQSLDKIQLNTSKFVLLLPIIFFFIYLNFTVFLFAFGPWPYPVADGTSLYGFLFFAHLALLIGYLSSIYRTPQGNTTRWKIENIVTVSLIVNLIILVPTTIFRTGSLLPDMASAIENPGEAYALYGFNQDKGIPFIEYIRMVFAPFLSILFPLTVFYWARLNWFIRVGAFFCILSMTAVYISMGTNKGLVDLILLAPWLLLAGHFSGALRLMWSRRIGLTIGGITVAIMAFYFFTATQTTRIGSGAKSGYFYPLNIYAERDNFMVRNLPPDIQVGMWSLAIYTTQGYYGLYLSLKEPFFPMFGIGNSMFLFRQAARITGIDEIADLPYPVRISKYGWNAYVQWSSIYPWLASDISFPGTIILLFLIGRLFALSWLGTIKEKNPFAVAMFAQFLIMLFYFPANNQCLQNGTGLISFWVTLLLWQYTSRKLAKKHIYNGFSFQSRQLSV